MSQFFAMAHDFGHQERRNAGTSRRPQAATNILPLQFKAVCPVCVTGALPRVPKVPKVR